MGESSCWLNQEQVRMHLGSWPLAYLAEQAYLIYLALDYRC